MWLLLAILACFLWGVVYVLDAHCVGRVFTRPWVGVVVSASFVAAVLPIGPLVLIGQEVPARSAVALALLAGAMFAASQAAYFQALRYTESGVVAAYLNITVIVLPAAGYFVFNEMLTARVYCGVTALVGASVLFCLLDAGSPGRWQAFGLGGAASLCQAAYYLLVKFSCEQCPAPVAVYLVLVGIAVTGLSPLLAAVGRQTLRESIPLLRPAARLILAIEAFHLLALVVGQLAIDAGSPTLVAAVEGTTPAVTFLLSIGLFAVSGRVGEPAAGRRLPAKLALVGVMAAGVWLVFSEDRP